MRRSDHCGGQSGHYRSPSYDNLLQPWGDGERLEIPTDRTAIKAQAVMALAPIEG